MGRLAQTLDRTNTNATNPELRVVLATALGFSYAKDITFNQTSLTAIHVLIPTTGAFFSYAAIYTANLLTKLIRLTNERGRELEKFLAARMFGKLQPYAEKSPRVTIAASLLFLLLWAAALLGGILH